MSNLNRIASRILKVYEFEVDLLAFAETPLLMQCDCPVFSIFSSP
jgi:hypothetical protein